MMNTYKRMTICITQELNHKLDNAKKSCYWKCSYSDMIRDLLAKGLETDEKLCKDEEH